MTEPSARDKKRATFGTPEHWAKREIDWRRYKIRRHGKPFNRDDFMNLWRIQGEKCPICQRPFDGRRVAVDHDHKTHEARGLLCAMPCNHYLVAKNTRSTAWAVIRYLDNPPVLWATTPHRADLRQIH